MVKRYEVDPEDLGVKKVHQSSIVCPSCGQSVSSKTQKCYHCGTVLDSVDVEEVEALPIYTKKLMQESKGKIKKYRLIVKSFANDEARDKFAKVIGRSDLFFLDLKEARKMTYSLPITLDVDLTPEAALEIKKIFMGIRCIYELVPLQDVRKDLDLKDQVQKQNRRNRIIMVVFLIGTMLFLVLAANLWVSLQKKSDLSEPVKSSQYNFQASFVPLSETTPTASLEQHLLQAQKQSSQVSLPPVKKPAQQDISSKEKVQKETLESNLPLRIQDGILLMPKDWLRVSSTTVPSRMGNPEMQYLRTYIIDIKEEEEKVKFPLGRLQGVKEGMKITVEKPEKPGFLTPQADTPSYTLEVTKVYKDVSWAKRKNPKDIIQIGDIAGLMVNSKEIERLQKAMENEEKAKNWLAHILVAQLKLSYQKNFKQYLALEKLVEDGLIDQKLADGIEDGYRFFIEIPQNKSRGSTASNSGFAIYAVPIHYNTSGEYSFFLDQSRILRGRDLLGKSASSQDPVLFIIQLKMEKA